ncbi:DUF6406 domain-containing protein [Actinocatenispora rupis]|uniref:Uncharacterized protein n=1 Tax=Actinocatenispora rupis TaxID=519421 RepID=A0A8J3NE05_9ACTN|nr:DUF6406 domain-containing protein [Actinocatenispora rupis]GID13552.1 hypothetical protein Aru02nite_44410 [Actinocatenispora rupis]
MADIVVELAHGTVAVLGTARVGAVAVSTDEGPLTVELAVLPADGEEYDVEVSVGERVAIGGVRWLVDDVDVVDLDNYVVRLRAVTDPMP